MLGCKMLAVKGAAWKEQICSVCSVFEWEQPKKKNKYVLCLNGYGYRNVWTDGGGGVSCLLYIYVCML